MASLTELYIISTGIGFCYVSFGFIMGQIGSHGSDAGPSDAGDFGGHHDAGDFGGHHDAGDFGGHHDAGDFGGHHDAGDFGGHHDAGDFGGHHDAGDVGGHHDAGDVGGHHDAGHHHSAIHKYGPDSLGMKAGEGINGDMALNARRRHPVWTLLRIFSPTSIAMFAFWFGVIGLLGTHTFKLGAELALVPAIAIGLLMTAAMQRAMSFIVSKMHSSTNYREDQLIGSVGEVTVSIPATGLGEIIYMVGKNRQTASARLSSSQATLPAGSRVLILDVQDGIFYVEPWSDEALLGDYRLEVPPEKATNS